MVRKWSAKPFTRVRFSPTSPKLKGSKMEIVIGLVILAEVYHYAHFLVILMSEYEIKSGTIYEKLQWVYRNNKCHICVDSLWSLLYNVIRIKVRGLL